MRLQKNNSGFTLIELIVVITILAILGTIAFISLQGYSAGARNSKRLSDMGQLTTAIETKVVEGVSKLNTVTQVTGNEVAFDDGTTVGSLGGMDAGDIDSTNYKAGVPNYTLLGVKQSEFSDPDGPEYLVGVTTIGGSRHQLASKYEEDGADVYKVTGNYVARADDKDVGFSSDIADGATTVQIDDNFGFFRGGDVLATVGKISSVSDSQTVLTFATGTGDTGADAALTVVAASGVLNLAIGEAAGLIDNDAATPVIITEGMTY